MALGVTGGCSRGLTVVEEPRNWGIYFRALEYEPSSLAQFHQIAHFEGQWPIRLIVLLLLTQ